MCEPKNKMKSEGKKCPEEFGNRRLVSSLKVGTEVLIGVVGLGDNSNASEAEKDCPVEVSKDCRNEIMI